MELEPIPNLAPLRKVVDWVLYQAGLPYEKQQWVQGTWHASSRMAMSLYGKSKDCGSAFCVAGKVCDDAGIEWDEDGSTQGTLDGRVRSAPELAQEILGITNSERTRLFSASCDEQDIREIAEEIAERAGERLY